MRDPPGAEPAAGEAAAGEARPGARAHLWLLAYALSSLRRRRGRALAVGGGLIAATALLSAVIFLTDALRAEAGRARAASPDLVVQRLVGGRPALLSPELGRLTAKLPGVARVTGRVWGYLFLPSLQGNVTVMGLAEGRELSPLILEQGRPLTPADHGGCVLGRELARALGVGPGDRVRFPAADDRGPSCQVLGVFSSPVSLYTSDVALLPEDDAREVLGLPRGQLTDLAVDLTNPDESAVVASTVTRMMPGARVLERRLFERVQALSYGRKSGFVLGASLPALLALLVLAHDRASGLGASERREIAVQKASGWSSGDVLIVKMYESLLLALTAAALGLALGYAWAFWLGAPGLREAIAGWSVLYPEVRLTPEVSLGQLIGLLSLVTVPYVALSVGPAWRASILDPMEALRAS